MVIFLIVFGDFVQASMTEYDVILKGGRVMDPESGLNAIRNVGIKDGKVSVITSEPLYGNEIIDVSSLVVAPGFIDLNQHGYAPNSQKYHAKDGITTALKMESGAYPVKPFYDLINGKLLINSGTSVGYACIRYMIKNDGNGCPSDTTWGGWKADIKTTEESLSEEENEIMMDHLKRGFESGAVGVGIGIEYIPGAGRKEIYNVFKVAAEYGAPVFTHVRRRTIDGAPGVAIQSVQEVIADAAVTGASLQIIHVASTGLKDTPVIIDMIAGAQKHGMDITVELHPYTAASTSIDSAVFSDGFLERLGIDFGSLEYIETGERLTKQSFEKYRKIGGLVIIHNMIPAKVVSYGIKHPIVSVASDGLEIVSGKEHPRSAGTFARLLGKFVREDKILSLMMALKKITLMPAQRMEKFVPVMRNKGRIKIGGDADITVFDPLKIIDRSTYGNIQYSEGIKYVLVGGKLIVKEGRIVDNIFPGRIIRNKLVPSSSIRQ
jgi:N-acyl-D-aspartate/D-glutamate deacylase